MIVERPACKNDFLNLPSGSWINRELWRVIQMSQDFLAGGREAATQDFIHQLFSCSKARNLWTILVSRVLSGHIFPQMKDGCFSW